MYWIAFIFLHYYTAFMRYKEKSKKNQTTHNIRYYNNRYTRNKFLIYLGNFGKSPLCSSFKFNGKGQLLCNFQ